MMDIPGNWMRETSGVLRPVVEKFLAGEELDAREIVTMRAYLRQWIAADGFVGPEIDELRSRVGDIEDMHDLNTWIEDALDAGADPL